MTEQEARAAIVAEAHRWIGAKWHHGACVPYVAVDCGMILVDVFIKVGLIPPFDVLPYARQEPLHRAEERIIQIVEQFAHEISGDPLPGDVVGFRFGRTYSHWGIVVGWPKIIHAYVGEGVCTADVDTSHLSRRPARFFSIFGGGDGR